MASPSTAALLTTAFTNLEHIARITEDCTYDDNAQAAEDAGKGNWGDPRILEILKHTVHQTHELVVAAAAASASASASVSGPALQYIAAEASLMAGIVDKAGMGSLPIRKEVASVILRIVEHWLAAHDNKAPAVSDDLLRKVVVAVDKSNDGWKAAEFDGFRESLDKIKRQLGV